ncbi:MAG: hypothetical protein HQK75_10610 [Candidatus Magnetomorum sp.]|nr:hypothetical protein [Candidatus Magnetomorum sp.]
MEELRYSGQNNQLICPECEQPVLVKAGEIKQWHFSLTENEEKIDYV